MANLTSLIPATFIIAAALFNCAGANTSEGRKTIPKSSSLERSTTVTENNTVTESNTIKANLPLNQYEISPHFIGYNNNWVRKNNVWQDFQMRTLFQKSTAAHLRYPGGTNSSFWDYANDTVFKDLNPDKIKENWIKGLTRRNFVNPVEELGLVTRDMGDQFAIIFVANLVTQQKLPSAPPESTQWYAELDTRYEAFKAALKRAEAVGVPIEYIELGNEYYFPAGYYGEGSCGTCGGQGAFPHTGESYATAANYFARKLRADYPDVKIAAVGTIAKAESSDRRRYWNSKVVSKLDRELIDAITVHFYHGNNPPAGFDKEAGIGQTMNSWNRAWSKRFAGGDNFDRVPVARDNPEDWDVWYTEYAAFQHRMQDTWHYAFYVSNALDYWLRHTNVTLTSKQSWKTSFNDDFTVKPFVKALSIWSQASVNQTKAGRIILDQAPKIRGSEHDGIVGWMFSGNEQPRVLFINYTKNTHNIDLSSIDHDQSNQLKVTTVAADNLLEGPSAPTATEQEQASTVISLDPFSISLVEGIDEDSSNVTP